MPPPLQRYLGPARAGPLSRSLPSGTTSLMIMGLLLPRPGYLMITMESAVSG